MAEPPGDVLLLTYVELGDRLGVAPDTARLRAKRRGWDVQHGNDGKARVRVPSGELPETPPERPRRGADELPTVGELLAELREVQADAAEARLEAAVATAKLEERESAHAGEAGLLREQLGRELARVTDLERQLAEARRPWWARLVVGRR
jgi:hypothetical protein